MRHEDLIPIFDGHNDSLLSVHLKRPDKEAAFLHEGEIGHIDIPRARRGGLLGGLFALYTPNDPTRLEPPEEDLIITEDGYEVREADPIDPDYARSFVDELLVHLDNILAGSGEVRLCLSADDIRSCMADRVLAIMIHIEGAEAVAEDLSNLPSLYDRGMRSLGLVWSRRNVFGSGVPFRHPASPDTGPGLTHPGVNLVKACNRMGIMVDLSHLNEKGFWDVARISDRPLVATHSDVHALCPSTRNLTDKQLAAIAESGGVVGVNFCVNTIRSDGHEDPDTSIDSIVRHFDYMIDFMGPDHVAFGTDFDGATIPQEVGDVTGLPAVMEALRARGYDRATLEKLGWRNWLRVLDTTLVSQ